MTLTRPHFIDKAWPNAIDLRKNLAGMLPREGLFPAAETLQGVAFAGAGWAVSARAFTAAFKRGGAPYSLAYGTGLGANDGTVAAAWTLGGAPGSGSRVDRLWVRWVDPTQGEALTTPGGESVARAVPIFGITPGTPAAAAWPSGVQRIAEVSVPAGAASAAGATITQAYPFAHLSGGPVYVRTIAERDALTGVLEGELAYVIDTDQLFEYIGAVGWVHVAGKPKVSGISFSGIYSGATTRVYEHAGTVGLEGVITAASTNFPSGTEFTVGSIPSSLAPRLESTFPTVVNGIFAVLTVKTTGTITFTVSSTFTAPLFLSIDTAEWLNKALA
jgi:hypothetical protein